MVAYQGEKMSKSLGNLVLVSRLVAGGVDPRVIRLALLAENYRSDWEWTDDHLCTAGERLASWEAWASRATREPTPGSLDELRVILANDSTPRRRCGGSTVTSPPERRRRRCWWMRSMRCWASVG